MALLQSQDIRPQFSAADFCLKGIDDKTYCLKDFSQAEGLLVAFICNHCPYVRAIEDRLIGLASYMQKNNGIMIGICSNDPKSYPEDSKENLKKRAQEKNYNFPYLIDEDQTVARAYKAVCTPDLYLFDKERKLYYHGQLDDNWRDSHKVVREDLKDAFDALLKGQPISAMQKPSMGCSIKWKS